MIPPDNTNDEIPARRNSDEPRRRPARSLVSAARGRLSGSTAAIFLRRLAALDFLQSVTVFGAVMLLSVLPFVMLLSSLANHRIDTDLSRNIGLDRQGANIVSQLFTSPPTDSVADLVVALAIATVGTMAVANFLQVIYERAFGQEHRGWRDILRYFIWAGALFGVLTAGSVISRPVHASLGRAGEALVSFAIAAGFFWWTMHFLLARRVPWHMVVRPAMLTALLWVALGFFSSAYFSAAVISDSRLYGKIGVVFSLLTWFIAIGAIIVLGTAAGATWEQRKGRLAAPKAGSAGPVSRTSGIRTS